MSFYRIRPRAGTAAQWELANPVLGEREIGIEVPEEGVGTGVSKIKIGDGAKAWNDLPYAVEPVEVVDNLLSESTELPLSANQGRVLRGMIPYFSDYAYKTILSNESFTATKECAVYVAVAFNNVQYGTINIRVNSSYVYEQQNPSSAKIGFGQLVYLKKGDILSVGGTGLDTYTIRVYE